MQKNLNSFWAADYCKVGGKKKDTKILMTDMSWLQWKLSKWHNQYWQQSPKKRKKKKESKSPLLSTESLLRKALCVSLKSRSASEDIEREKKEMKHLTKEHVWSDESHSKLFIIYMIKVKCNWNISTYNAIKSTCLFNHYSSIYLFWHAI